MSMGELFIRMLAAFRPLLPAVIAAIAATILALLYLYFRGRHVWLESKRFPLFGLFFGLGTRGIVCLSSAWLKLIFPIVYVISFQKLELIQYLMILIPGLVLVFCAGRFSKAVGAFVNLCLELVALFSASLICGYITDMHAGTGFLLIYIAIGIFLSLFAIYLFLQELEYISATRKIDAGKVWRKTVDGEE